jgi:hypothetical protein
LNNKLLSVEILFHDELALSQITKKYFICTFMQRVIHVFFATIAITKTFATAEEVTKNPLKRISSLG